MDVTDIRYRDLAQRENDERSRLAQRLNQLDRSARSRAGAGVGGETDPIFYSVEEKAERDRIAATFDLFAEIDLKKLPREVCDPLYVAARDQFNTHSGLLIGKLGNPAGPLDDDPPGVSLQMGSGKRLNRATAVDCALTIGLLIEDGIVPPRVKIDPVYESGKAAEFKNGTNTQNDDFIIVSDRDDPRWAEMGRAFFQALGEAQSYSPLSSRVLPMLAREGATGSDDAPIVSAQEFAKVLRALALRGITGNETQLARKVSEALDRIQRVGSDDTTEDIGIDLPVLDTVPDPKRLDQIKQNVLLMSVVIPSAMLDELKAFQVIEEIMHSAQNGTIALGRGNAGKLLYNRWKAAPNRINEGERRDIYAMTMGQPGGNSQIRGNTEFNDLWLRFVSSVSQFVRNQEVDKLLRSAMPGATGAQQMRKAARDLVNNLSLHGYGMTYYAALELQSEIKEMIALLSDPELLGVYGARDMWGLIDVVATASCGGARTSSRYQTLATCGAIISAWLANNLEKIMRPTGPLLDMMDVRSPMPRSAGKKATSEPTDYDLVNACELWLADTAVSDSRVDEMSQPRMSPVMTSQPVPIPAFAREFMDDLPGVGGDVGMGMGLRNGAARHH